MRGIETVYEHPKPQENWEGDPVAGQQLERREIRDCVLIPRVSPDDENQIVDGWQLFVPPHQVPPHPESAVEAPDPADLATMVMWEIDGGIGPYRKSAYKGALLALKRQR